MGVSLCLFFFLLFLNRQRLGATRSSCTALCGRGGRKVARVQSKWSCRTRTSTHPPRQCRCQARHTLEQQNENEGERKKERKRDRVHTLAMVMEWCVEESDQPQAGQGACLNMIGQWEWWRVGMPSKGQGEKRERTSIRGTGDGPGGGMWRDGRVLRECGWKDGRQ